ncbi:MAG: hypothetical protein B1H02_01555 [Candidatus Latescibacteria bacterium 4484_107]|nr:MAG: hypothetical protein B1H02_01555 [Candidatus Latescibacteria bacterium 4484_107]
MSNILKLAAILGLITVIAACSLALVNQATKPQIEAYKAQQQIQARQEVLPAAKEGVYVLTDEGSDFPYYMGYAHADTTEPVGVVLLTSGKGYSSTIEMAVGVDLSGALTGISIVSQQETPGLGAKITEVRYGESEPWFQAQFKGKTLSQLSVDKDGGAIDSITGATISSRAVTDGVRSALKRLEAKQRTAKP